MPHGAHAWCSEEQLEVSVPVPRQRAHAIAVVHAECRERVGELTRASSDFGVGATMGAPVRLVRDDGRLGMRTRCMLDER